MGRPLSDAAVGDGFLLAVDTLAAVELIKLVRRLEGAVLVYRLGPGDVGGAGDVTTPLEPFLGQVGGGQQLPAVLVGQRTSTRFTRLALTASSTWSR